MSALRDKAVDPSAEGGVYRYHLLRAALESYKRSPAQLEPAELAQAERKAQRSFELESLVINAPESASVVIDQNAVDRALEEVAGRYASRDEFIANLAANDLNESELAHALYRELLFDGTLRRVAGEGDAIGDDEVAAYYNQHLEKFNPPERRLVRHILITINDEFPENRHDPALQRIKAIAADLAGRSERFEDLARRHSECPSAMDGGLLGQAVPGQLYPQLDEALFAMAEGAVSPVLESEAGFHILWCEKITPGRHIPLAEVDERIRQLLIEQSRRRRQQQWVLRLRERAKG